jgi:hypothetical protein
MQTLPDFFKPILWSYRLADCDPQKMKRVIIRQTFAYGTLAHWRWICDYYGKPEVVKIFKSFNSDSLHKKTSNLIAALFDLKMNPRRSKARRIPTKGFN